MIEGVYNYLCEEEKNDNEYDDNYDYVCVVLYFGIEFSVYSNML